MTHEADIEMASGAYALDAMTLAETLAFERYLASAEQARYEATELRDTAVQLGLAVAPQRPRPELRASLLATIATLPQQATAAAPVVAAHVPVRRRSRRTPFTIASIAVLAGAAAVAVVLGAVLAPPTASSVMFAADAAESTIAVDGGGDAHVAWSDELDAATIRFEGVDAPAAGTAYQLWYVDASGARSAGLLTTDGWTVLDGDLKAGDSIAVTVEPAGGSDSPTSEPIVVVPTA